MLSQRIFQLCVGLALIGTDTAHSGDDPTNANYTQTKKGVTLRATLPTHRRNGESVPLQVELKNASPYDITWVITRADAELHLSVQDAAGKGAKLREGEKENNRFYRLIIKTLRPKKTHSWKIDLAEKYVLPPGDYKVSLSLSIDLTPPTPPDTATLQLGDMKLAISAAP